MTFAHVETSLLTSALPSLPSTSYAFLTRFIDWNWPVLGKESLALQPETSVWRAGRGHGEIHAVLTPHARLTLVLAVRRAYIT